MKHLRRSKCSILRNKNKNYSQMEMSSLKYNWGKTEINSDEYQYWTTAKTIESLSVNQLQAPANVNNKLVRRDQIVVEQSKDTLVLNIKLKFKNEECLEQILLQDARWRHYAMPSKMERLILRDEIVIRQ